MNIIIIMNITLTCLKSCSLGENRVFVCVCVCVCVCACACALSFKYMYMIVHLRMYTYVYIYTMNNKCLLYINPNY